VCDSFFCGGGADQPKSHPPRTILTRNIGRLGEEKEIWGATPEQEKL
jgi:hypothetical protein